MLFAFVAVAVLFIFAEGIVRMSGWGVLLEEELFSDVYNAAYEMLPNAANPWSAIQENLNSEGFRGRQIPVKRTPGVMRIISVGDSTTFGVGVEAHETYSYVLEQSINRLGLRTEVFNAGIPGTNLWQQLLLFERELLKYKPDLVILYSAPNTRLDLFHVRRAIESGSWGLKARGILSHMHLYRVMRRYLKPPKFEELYSQYPLPNQEGPKPLAPTRWIIKDAKRDLARFRQLCVDNGIVLLAAGVMPRDIFKEAREEGIRSGDPNWKSFFIKGNVGGGLALVIPETGVELYRPEDEFLDASYSQELFIDDVHFTSEGHLLMAKILVQTICERNLLPIPCPNSQEGEGG
jgi:hypothetical protein